MLYLWVGWEQAALKDRRVQLDRSRKLIYLQLVDE